MQGILDQIQQYQQGSAPLWFAALEDLLLPALAITTLATLTVAFLIIRSIGRR